MPAALMDRQTVLDKIFAAFRTYGYEGTTLARLSEATGLGRASLYHHFPGGKEQMVREVLQLAQAALQRDVVGPLEGTGTPHARVRRMIENLKTLYANGEASCVINLMGVGEAGETFRGELSATTEVWLQGLERTLKAAGIRAAAARKLAIDTVVRIEGSLVVSRAIGDPSVFIRALGESERELEQALGAG
jgi:AcrR family transcriptional regulator